MRFGRPSRRDSGDRTTEKSRVKVRWQPGIEDLEGRQLLSTGVPDLAMVSASTPDSKSVLVDYTVTGADLGQSFDLAIYRSSDATFDASDELVTTLHISKPGDGSSTGTLDLAGNSATSLGEHVISVPVANGLAINPEHPYVLAVANPTGTLHEANSTNDVASFRVYSIAIVTHGGLQSTVNNRIPAWENRMANALKSQGYDAVLPFNWVAVSGDAGSAAKQGPRLAKMVRQLVAQAPAGEPVDLHFIGHSEGTVINGLALNNLQKNSMPAIDQGYIQDTLLDPHAANNGVLHHQYSTSDTFLGGIARQMINSYQAKAQDPPAMVPSNVDSADVYYQHTPTGMTPETNSGWFNLWGQVPVNTPTGSVPISYTDITGPGISHSGNFSVHEWYMVNVMPYLGNGQPGVSGPLLTAQVAPADGTGPVYDSNIGLPKPKEKTVVSVSQPTFIGKTAPGASVTLAARRAGASTLTRLGKTTADAFGSWSITTQHRIPDGYIRLVAIGSVTAAPGQTAIHSMPIARMGTITVNAPRLRR